MSRRLKNPYPFHQEDADSNEFYRAEYKIYDGLGAEDVQTRSRDRKVSVKSRHARNQARAVKRGLMILMVFLPCFI